METGVHRNHFELFGLPAVFELDLGLLNERYRDLQRHVHPDRFAGASDRQRLLSVQRTAEINEAYQALKDPLKRARHLLELRGLDAELENNTVMDREFLMEQMDLREELEVVGDADDPPQALDVLRQEIERRIASLTATLREQFQRGDQQTLQDACDTLRKLRFMQRLREQALDLEEQLFPL